MTNQIFDGLFVVHRQVTYQSKKDFRRFDSAVHQRDLYQNVHFWLLKEKYVKRHISLESTDFQYEASTVNN